MSNRESSRFAMIVLVSSLLGRRCERSSASERKTQDKIAICATRRNDDFLAVALEFYFYARLTIVAGIVGAAFWIRHGGS